MTREEYNQQIQKYKSSFNKISFKQTTIQGRTVYYINDEEVSREQYDQISMNAFSGNWADDFVGKLQQKTKVIYNGKEMSLEDFESIQKQSQAKLINHSSSIYKKETKEVEVTIINGIRYYKIDGHTLNESQFKEFEEAFKSGKKYEFDNLSDSKGQLRALLVHNLA